MTTFSVIHNIPSPYRLHLFRVLYKRLQTHNIRFHVHFMALSHADRPHWQPAVGSLGFPYTFWYDFGPDIRGKTWHLNPSMISVLRQIHSDYLLVGGAWDSLTGLLASLLAYRRVGIVWQEGNTSTPGQIHGLVGKLKRLLLRRFDYIAVPGIEGQRHLNLLCPDWDVQNKSVLLPNIIDETLFSPGWNVENQVVRDQVRRELGVAPHTRVAIWPARLIPAKGVVEFLAHLQPQLLLLQGWRILLLGQGPLQCKVQQIINHYNLDASVQLIPYFPYDRMPLLYQASDLFLLPSVHDPNPLSVIEALHSGLPLLVSKRIGNFPEAMEEGVNGWSFNPHSPSDVQRATELAFNADHTHLSAMGVQSLRRAHEFWRSLYVVDRFLNAIL